jgi:hypothetical protein
MRLLLASALLASVLLVGTRVHAAATDEPAPSEAIGRCREEPMSLAFAIAEYEASRALTERSLTSSAEPVTAAPMAVEGEAAPAPRPAPAPRACRAANDPGCCVAAPPAEPIRVHLEQSADGFVLPLLALSVPAACVELVRHPRPEHDGRALDGYRAPPWRPPAH